MSRLFSSVAVVLFAFATYGCHTPETDRGQRSTVTVFAASSLTDVFGELEREFEAANSDIDVKLSFAGSQVLRMQIEQGGRADLFASANSSHVEALLGAGLLAEAAPFARNELVVIVPADNPASLGQFSDLPRARRLVVGTANVPVGLYTREVLDHAAAQYGEAFASAVRANIVSEESNVRLVRTKVELGEADAAVVYRTDGLASTRVRMIEIPADLNASVDYQLGVLESPGQSQPVDQFMAFLRSERGQGVLRRNGFLPRSR